MTNDNVDDLRVSCLFKKELHQVYSDRIHGSSELARMALGHIAAAAKTIPVRDTTELTHVLYHFAQQLKSKGPVWRR